MKITRTKKLKGGKCNSVRGTTPGNRIHRAYLCSYVRLSSIGTPCSRSLYSERNSDCSRRETERAEGSRGASEKEERRERGKETEIDE